MGVKTRREKEKAIRQEEIIDTAERLFFSQGYDNTTMEDIAREAEFSKRTLYKYYQSKNELCLAIIIRRLVLLRKNFEEIAQLPGSKSLDKLLKIKNHFLSFITDYPMFEKAILTYRYHKIECDKESSVLRDSVVENVRITNILVQLIEEGKNDGSIHEDIDASIIGNALWGQVTGILPNLALSDTQSKETPGKNPKEIFDEFFDFILEALKA